MKKPDIDQEAVYPVADRWVGAAFRSDGSLFTPGSAIWTAANLDELTRRFMKQPDESGDRFEVKLRRQLAGAPAEIIQLMAEVPFIHLLVASRDSMSGRAKRALINEVLSWTSPPVAMPDEADVALDNGLAATGTAFLTHRPFQVPTVIEFVSRWKALPAEEAERALKDPWLFKSIVHQVHQKGAFAQREALLHFVHPDTFEAIISRDQKEQIVRAFEGLVDPAITDVDERLLEMRRILSLQYGDRFSWYQPNVRIRWQDDSKWDQFVGWARRFFDDPAFDDKETNYKVKVAALTAEALAALEGPQDTAIGSVRFGELLGRNDRSYRPASPSLS